MGALAGSPSILYINHETVAGGATVHREEFVRAARELEAHLILYPEPRAIAEGSGGGGAWQRIKHRLYHRWTELALLLMTIKHAPAHARMILRVRPQVLLLRYSVHISAVLMARLLGVPVVLEINAPYYLYSRHARVRLRLEAFWRWLERRAIESASAVVVTSRPFLEHYLSLGFPHNKFTVVPMSVDPSRFDPAISGEAVRQRHRLGDRVVVGFVGLLEAWLGIDWFLEAISRLGPLLDNVVVLIVGSGPLEGRLRQVVARLGLEERVRFAGFVPHDQVPEFLAAFDIAIAPYRKVELFYLSPMKLYEYLAMGKPVITPRMGQSAEMIAHGENGLLYEPDDDEGLLELLRLLIRDVDFRARLGRTALARSRDLGWTWERHAAAILQVCRAAAARLPERTIASRGPS